ncbi:hypothetical protein PGT21_028670 [Puccinia graminis f. sp. tritici]|uniref:Uncharacterized protein n=1 Tax=Puccinia graminis f. sp. tritici TaxID=56615 RepID=A0A5B0SFI0_PUCGR|nr:hypothetical protein PGT21_028670 [Puccinia graminis f. sp. tritici]KAA1135244.1 hypothetical protein PGTUg99_021660 [Puccinia graminis f. sp. tritici]
MKLFHNSDIFIVVALRNVISVLILQHLLMSTIVSMEIMDHITFRDLADPKRRAAVESAKATKLQESSNIQESTTSWNAKNQVAGEGDPKRSIGSLFRTPFNSNPTERTK